MDEISFAIQPLGGGDETPSIIPVVNGVNLTRLIEEFEHAHQFEPVGGYAGLVLTTFNYGPLDIYFLGQTNIEYFETGGYHLLGCSCGEVGCWPLNASISQLETRIVWDRFRQPHRRDRDYSTFGPFSFNFDQYRAAVQELAAKSPSR
jgi:hypothetical protein